MSSNQKSPYVNYSKFISSKIEPENRTSNNKFNCSENSLVPVPLPVSDRYNLRGKITKKKCFCCPSVPEPVDFRHSYERKKSVASSTTFRIYKKISDNSNKLRDRICKSEFDKLYKTSYGIKWAKNFFPENILHQIRVRQATACALFGQPQFFSIHHRKNIPRNNKTVGSFENTDSYLIKSKKLKKNPENAKLSSYQEVISGMNKEITNCDIEPNMAGIHTAQITRSLNIPSCSLSHLNVEEININAKEVHAESLIMENSVDFSDDAQSYYTSDKSSSAISSCIVNLQSKHLLDFSYINKTMNFNLSNVVVPEYSETTTFFNIAEEGIRTIDACFREVGAEAVNNTFPLLSSVKESKILDKILIDDNPVLESCTTVSFSNKKFPLQKHKKQIGKKRKKFYSRYFVIKNRNGVVRRINSNFANSRSILVPKTLENPIYYHFNKFKTAREIVKKYFRQLSKKSQLRRYLNEKFKDSANDKFANGLNAGFNDKNKSKVNKSYSSILIQGLILLSHRSKLHATSKMVNVKTYFSDENRFKFKKNYSSILIQNPVLLPHRSKLPTISSEMVNTKTHFSNKNKSKLNKNNGSIFIPNPVLLSGHSKPSAISSEMADRKILSVSSKGVLTKVPPFSSKTVDKKMPAVSSEMIHTKDTTISSELIVTKTLALSPEQIFTKTPAIFSEPIVKKMPAVSCELIVSKIPDISSELIVTKMPAISSDLIVTKTPAISSELIITKIPAISSGLTVTKTSAGSSELIVTKTPAISSELIVTKASASSSELIVTKIPAISSELTVTKTSASSSELIVTKIPAISSELTITKMPVMSSEQTITKMPVISSELVTKMPAIYSKIVNTELPVVSSDKAISKPRKTVLHHIRRKRCTNKDNEMHNENYSYLHKSKVFRYPSVIKKNSTICNNKIIAAAAIKKKAIQFQRMHYATHIRSADIELSAISSDKVISKPRKTILHQIRRKRYSSNKDKEMHDENDFCLHKSKGFRYPSVIKKNSTIYNNKIIAATAIKKRAVQFQRMRYATHTRSADTEVSAISSNKVIIKSRKTILHQTRKKKCSSNKDKEMYDEISPCLHKSTDFWYPSVIKKNSTMCNNKIIAAAAILKKAIQFQRMHNATHSRSADTELCAISDKVTKPRKAILLQTRKKRCSSNKEMHDENSSCLRKRTDFRYPPVIKKNSTMCSNKIIAAAILKKAIQFQRMHTAICSRSADTELPAISSDKIVSKPRKTILHHTRRRRCPSNKNKEMLDENISWLQKSKDFKYPSVIKKNSTICSNKVIAASAILKKAIQFQRMHNATSSKSAGTELPAVFSAKVISKPRTTILHQIRRKRCPSNKEMHDENGSCLHKSKGYRYPSVIKKNSTMCSNKIIAATAILKKAVQFRRTHDCETIKMIARCREKADEIRQRINGITSPEDSDFVEFYVENDYEFPKAKIVHLPFLEKKFVEYKSIGVFREEYVTQIILCCFRNNAVFFTLEALREITDVLVRAKSDASCLALVINGIRDTFCSGLDVSVLIGPQKETISTELAFAVKQFIEALCDFNKPLVGVVSGPAIGLGLTLLTYMDSILASETASFSMPYHALGYFPEGAATVTVPQVVGYQMAMDLFISGRSLTAEEALEIGLITDMYHPALLPCEVARKLRTLCQRSSYTFEIVKRFLKTPLHVNVKATLESETKLLPCLWLSPECQDCLKRALSTGILGSSYD